MRTCSGKDDFASRVTKDNSIILGNSNPATRRLLSEAKANYSFYVYPTDREAADTTQKDI